MNEAFQNRGNRLSRSIRVLLLALALLTSPALCCGGLRLLDSLPSAWLPSSLDFMVNVFEGNARIENNTSEILYITAITTTYGDPRVIPQNIAFRQRDIPVHPQSSVVLQYDSADLPLSGIAVCKSTEDCRFLSVKNTAVYEVNSYEALEKLEVSWLEAIQSTPIYNYGMLLIAGFSVIPIFLFSGWIYLTRRESGTAG